MYLNISVLFTVDTSFILKLAFLLLFVSVLLQGHLGGRVVAIIVNVVTVVFICLSIYLFRFFVYLFIFLLIFFFVASTVILIFVVVAVIATIAFVVGAIVAFCVYVVIVAPNLMLMFSILVLSCVPYFTVNSVGK